MNFCVREYIDRDLDKITVWNFGTHYMVKLSIKINDNEFSYGFRVNESLGNLDSLGKYRDTIKSLKKIVLDKVSDYIKYRKSEVK